jgi:hypothetical protein
MAFISGQFQPFRATKTVHLGSIQKDLVAGTIVQFDGQKVRLGDEEKSLPELVAAIRVGWLVPASDTTSVYRSQPAGVEVRKADSRGNTRELVQSTTIVSSDERDMGTVANVRPEGAPPTHTATRAGEIAKKASPVVTQQSSDEGTVVSRFKTPTRFSGTKVDGTNDSRIINDLDNNASPTWERVAKPLEGQLVGESLSDLLPDAPTSRVPAPGVAGEGTAIASADDRARGNVTFSAGGSSVGDAEDGVVVGKIGAAPAPVAAPEPEVVDVVPPEAIVAAKVEIIRQFVPGFDWNMKDHWRTRVKKALDQASNPAVLNAILSLETDTVKRFVQEQIAASQPS